MIYGDLISKNNFNKLIKSDIEIMREFYENEINILNYTINYQNKISSISESYELEVLHEGFISNITEKIKELVRKFIDWVKRIAQSIKNLFTKDKKGSSIEDKKESVNTAKKVLSNSSSSEKEKIKAVNSLGTVSRSEDSKKIKFKYIKSKEFINDFKPNIKKYVQLLESGMGDVNFNFKDLNNEELLKAAKERVQMLREEISKLPTNMDLSKYTVEKEFNNIEELQRYAMKTAGDHYEAISNCKNFIAQSKEISNDAAQDVLEAEREFNSIKNSVSNEVASFCYSIINLYTSLSIKYINFSLSVCNKYLNTIKVIN